MLSCIILLLSAISLRFSLISATDCSKPDSREEIFVLSEDHLTYSEGFVLKVVCVPGYNPEIAYELTCDKSGQWSGNFPHCEKAEHHLRWWILLIVVVTVMVAVPCTVPRVYFHYYDERHVLRRKALQQRNSSYSQTDGSNDALEMRMNQPLSEMAAPIDGAEGGDNGEPNFSKPLPPIKTSEGKFNEHCPDADESVMISSSPVRLPPMRHRSSALDNGQ